LLSNRELSSEKKEFLEMLLEKYFKNLFSQVNGGREINLPKDYHQWQDYKTVIELKKANMFDYFHRDISTTTTF
jgi:hypothetical protein